MFLVNRASDGGGCERKDTACVHICGEGNILINKGVYTLGCWKLVESRWNRPARKTKQRCGLEVPMRFVFCRPYS